MSVNTFTSEADKYMQVRFPQHTLRVASLHQLRPVNTQAGVTTTASYKKNELPNTLFLLGGTVHRKKKIHRKIIHQKKKKFTEENQLGSHTCYFTKKKKKEKHTTISELPSLPASAQGITEALITYRN